MPETAIHEQFENYTQHLMTLQRDNPGLFLGYLCWYSVPEVVSIPHGDFVALIHEHNAPIPVKLPPKPSDIFLRACTTIEQSFQRLGHEDGTHHNYLIRKVGSDNDYIYKQIVLERVDSDDHSLDFTVIADLRFNKQTNDIDGNPLVQDPVMLPPIMEGIKQYFKEQESLLTAYAVRESFRNSLEGNLWALSVRKAGGVYFVLDGAADRLASLEGLASAIPHVSFHVLPLIDDSNQRAMLRAAFEADTVEELNKLVEDVGKAREAKKGITTKQMVAFQRRYQDLVGKTRLYSEMLDDALDTSSASLEIAKMVIRSALGATND